MVSSDKKLSNVVGGKTARACDSCIRKRARWYCAADDAFLCQGCDAAVHSANPLARRHERVRLKTSCSTSPTLKFSAAEKFSPSWHHGFTRKARTPRGGGTGKAFRRASPPRNHPVQLVVPEIGGDDQSTSDNVSDEQLLYQVPVFDPQLCFSANSNEAAMTPSPAGAEDALVMNRCGGNKSAAFDLNSLNGLILPSDMELAEFAADVETLLGKGLDEESFDMEGLGLLDCGEHDQKGSTDNSRRSGERVLKVEEEEEGIRCEMSNDIDLMRGPFQLNFDYDSTITWGEEEEEEEEKVVAGTAGEVMAAGLAPVVKEDHDQLYDGRGCIDGDREKKILKLNYEAVMAAWDDKRSPWTTGDRPEFDPNLCWPDCVGGCGMFHHPYGDHRMGMMMTGNPAMLDGGREARVSRYREKRRTRLFSKKIRYEVRKLNAEKRPRMKGRFVKRASFGAPVAFPLLAK